MRVEVEGRRRPVEGGIVITSGGALAPEWSRRGEPPRGNPFAFGPRATLVGLALCACGETIRRMDASELRLWCLQQTGTTEDFPFGPEHSVFKVAGKMFALSALDRTPLEVSVKCEPDLAVGLRESYPAIRPGYHLNKRHWNTITLDGSLPDQLVRDLIEDSYDLVVSALPKRIREQIGWEAETQPATSVEGPSQSSGQARTTDP